MRYKRLQHIVYYVPLFFLFIAVFAPILANDKPLAVRIEGGVAFPVFSNKVFFSGREVSIYPDTVNWNGKKAIWPPVVYLPGRSDFLNLYSGPFDKQYRTENGEVVEMPLRCRHWLGTGKRGDDVLAGLIHGARISVFTSIAAMLIAFVIGIFLGTVSGYTGDKYLRTSVASLMIYALGLFLAVFYAFVRRKYILTESLSLSPTGFIYQLATSLAVFAGIMILSRFASGVIGRSFPEKKKVFFPVDSAVMRLIEIVHSVPLIILVLFIASALNPSYINLVLIMGLTLWTGIARLVRAEVLRVRELDFVTAARTLGFSEPRIIFNHILPHAIQPAIVAFVFGNAAAILLESSLSFLGAGVPPEMVTWGSIIAAGKESYQSWWLIVFPGLAIFLTIFSYNSIGEKIRDKLDPLFQKS